MSSWGPANGDGHPTPDLSAAPEVVPDSGETQTSDEFADGASVIELDVSVPEEVFESIEDQPVEYSREIIGTYMATTGPFPPPIMLEQYERISPGFTAELIRKQDEERAHRHQVEIKALGLAGRGQWFAFAIGIGGMLLAGYFVQQGAHWQGLGAFMTSIGALAAAFLRRPPSATED